MLIGLTMKLGLVSSSILFAPHTPPKNVAVPAPIVEPVSPAAKAPSTPVASVTPKAPVLSAPTTTIPPSQVPGGTTVTGYDCVITLTDNLGNTMTYSPGPAINGVCAEGTPEPYTVTYGGGN